MLKKSVVLKRKKMNIPRVDYKNILFFSLFLCGLILGVLTMKGEEAQLKSVLNDFFIDYINNKSGNTILGCFLDSAILTLFIPILTFIFGLCAVGVPIIIAMPTLIGIAVGMATGFLYSEYTFQGLGYAALIILPSAAIVIATLLKCCNEAISMSLEIVFSISGGSYPKSKNNELKEYCLRFLIFAVPLILAALLNSFCFKLFGSLFSFV